MSAKPEGKQASEAKGGFVTLNDAFRIYPNTAVAPMSFSGGEAFYASHTESDAELIAVTGTKKNYFRLDIADAMLGISHKHFVPLLSWGVVAWPGGFERLALIFARPPGESIFKTLQSQGRHLSEAEILTSILPPVVSVLRALSALEIAHGSIHPDNLFLAADRSIMLGECLSTPPSLSQPTWALTIERGMADPIGRGSGTIADDIYALGATMLCLALGQTPLQGLSDEEVINRKLEAGSFGAMLAKRPLSSSFAELLSGMLADNRKQRWTLDEVEAWVAGRRSMVRQANPALKAARPFMFGETELWDKRAIAIAFTKDPAEGLRQINNGELIKWVRRALMDVPLAERINEAITSPGFRGKGGSFENRLLAKVIIALHPTAPIRYQNMAVMPDGITTALYMTVVTEKSLQTLTEIITAQLPGYWFNLQADYEKEYDDFIKRLEYARGSLERNGLQRTIYELVPLAPYWGEHFKAYFIFNPAQFLLTLEKTADSDPKSNIPIDQHGSAFLAARDNAISEKLIKQLSVSTPDADRVLACLHILAGLQERSGINALPKLASWLGGMLNPAIDRFRNRLNRDKVKADLAKCVAAGDLVAMYKAVQNPALIQADRMTFARARAQFLHLGVQIQQLKHEMDPASPHYYMAGKEAATIVSGLAAVIYVVGILFTQRDQ